MLVPLKTLYYTDLNVLSTIFQTDSEVDNNYDDDDNEYEDDDLVENYLLHQDTVFDLLEPSTFFVGLQSPPKCYWPFFIAEVISKGFAKKNMADQFGHSVMAGEMYAKVVYLQKSVKRKKNS